MATESRETTRAARGHSLRLSFPSPALLYERLVHMGKESQTEMRERGRRDPEGKGMGTFLLSCG